MSTPPPGRGVLGWLGRQVGHVVKAVKTDVTPVVVTPAVVHRTEDVRELPHPTRPGVTLRRTTTDEVIVKTTTIGPPLGGGPANPRGAGG